MNREVHAFLDLAEESISATEELLRTKHVRVAVSRAYYAMFYAAQAVLASEHRTYSRHSAVISEFGKHFVKTGHFPARLHQFLRTAFDERAVADYDPTGTVPKKTAELMLRRAQEFLEAARDFLGKRPAER